MRPLSLKLRGFKGVRSGPGKDEVEIDLSGHTGLVAITGPNGSGKTTVLDNLHPYRIMPYRSGSYSPRSFSYYNECYGSDALKELVFDLDGRRFRSLILIDAERRKQEAYLYEWMVDGWKPLCDGRVDNYDRAVVELLGSPELFFTSVFRCQDAPRLSDYTKGEIKGVFTELLSIDALKEIGVRAKRRKDAHVDEVDWLKRERERLAGVVDESEKARLEAATLQDSVVSLEKELSALDDRIEKKREEIRKLEGRAVIYRKSVKERLEIESRVREITEKISKAQGLLSRANAVRKASAEEKHCLGKLESLKKVLTRLEEETTELQKRERTARETEKRLMEAKRKLSELRLARSHGRDSLKKELQRARESSKLLGEVPCGTEYHGRCPLLKNAVRDRDAMPEVINGLKDYEGKSGEESALEAGIGELEELLLPQKDVLKRLDEVIRKKRSVQEEIRALETEAAGFQELTKLLPEVEFAVSVHPGLVLEKKSLYARLREMDVDASSEKALKEAEKRLTDLIALRDRCAGDLREASIRLAVLEKAIADGEAAQKEMASLDGRMDLMAGDIAEWSILERAFGNDGIIALEIDDAGPTISALANDLLMCCFGPRFTVRIDTQAARASGKGLKETFDIIVFDSERNESKSLKTMSGGEKVWIEEAITRAVSLYNAGKSGRKFHALFTDEKDGALDFQRKKEFVAMKRRVLEVGGYDVEFFISQSPEVQEAADSTIKL